MNLNALFESFKQKCKTMIPFIKTKKGKRLSILFILIFVLMFFAPAFHEFVGTALIGCVAAPYLVLIWRKFDREHAIVPAVFLCIPMLLDMLIYHKLSVVTCLFVAIVCVLIAALNPMFSFFDNATDIFYIYLIAGAICVGIVFFALLFVFLVSVAWWIICLVAFLAVIAVFFTVVFSTAAYTATDAKRQKRKNHNRKRDYNFEDKQRDNKIYDLSEDEYTDVILNSNKK